MNQNGMYYITDDFKTLVRSLGGEWNDKKKRPIVCLIKSTESDDLYWAIPVGKVNHRDQQAMDRIKDYINKPNRDLRSCYYHLGRTTNKSIFFISDAIPITDKYILEEHKGSDNNPYEINRILNFEASNQNYFRQHITDIKNYLIQELEAEQQDITEQAKDTN